MRCFYFRFSLKWANSPTAKEEARIIESILSGPTVSPTQMTCISQMSPWRRIGTKGGKAILVLFVNGMCVFLFVLGRLIVILAIWRCQYRMQEHARYQNKSKVSPMTTSTLHGSSQMSTFYSAPCLFILDTVECHSLLHQDSGGIERGSRILEST